MSDVVFCPKCQRRLNLPERYRGHEVQCPSCTTSFRAGEPTEEPIPVVRAVARPSAAGRGPTADQRAGNDYGLDDAQDGPRPGRQGRRGRIGGRRRSPVPWLVLGALGLLAMCCVPYWLWQNWTSPQRFIPENRVRVQQDLQEAFGDKKGEPAKEGEQQVAVADPKIAEELIPLFRAIGKGFRDQDGDALVGFWDTERFVEVFLSMPGAPVLQKHERAQVQRGIQAEMSKGLANQATFIHWQQSEIRHLKLLGAEEVVAIVRHLEEDGTVLRMRWWLTRRHGHWRVYDMEDLDMSLRWTSVAATVMAQGPVKALEINQRTTHLRQAMLAMVKNQDVDAAERHLKMVGNQALPNPMEGTRHMLTAMVLLGRQQPGPALDALEKAHTFHPDMLCLDLFKGVAYNSLDQSDKALKHLETYRNLLGEDAFLCKELGLALNRLNRHPEACAMYRKSLDFNPKDVEAFLGLLHSLGQKDNRDELGTRFAKLQDPPKAFEMLAQDCRQVRDAWALEPIAQAMLKIDPDFVSAHFHLALVKAWNGQPVEAFAFFKTALSKETNVEKRAEYAEALLPALALSGRAVEVYALAPDGKIAFRLLAAELLKNYRSEELKRLATLHAKQYPFDPLLPLYWGAVYVHEGQYRLAEKAFSAGLAAAPAQVPLQPFRVGRVLARYHTGRALSAYADIEPRQETFQQLANLCLTNQKYDLLQQLLDAHDQQQPDDDKVLPYRYRLLLNQNRVAEGIAVFQKALAKQEQPQVRKQLVSTFLYEMVDVGKALEGYRAAPDAEEAFQILTDDLLGQGRRDELRQLLKVHGKLRPDDLLLRFYTAEMLLHDRAWDKAANLLETTWDKAPPNLRQRFRHNYLYAAYKAKRVLQAYQKVEPRREVFLALANFLARDKQGEQLEELIAVHRPNDANHPDLLYYEARAKVLLKQSATAMSLWKLAYQQQKVDFQRRSYTCIPGEFPQNKIYAPSTAVI